MTATCATAKTSIPPRSFFAAKKTKPSVPLPSERASSNITRQGWNIATTVNNSTITGAGNGR